MYQSVVNAPRITDQYITDQLFKSNLAFCVVCVVTLQTGGGAFTIDSSTPTLINVNEQIKRKKQFNYNKIN
jgi:flagellar assembly factor FliW